MSSDDLGCENGVQGRKPTPLCRSRTATRVRQDRKQRQRAESQVCVQGSSSHHQESASTPAHGGTLNDTAFPSRGALTIAFAHVAYRAAEEFAARRTGVAHFEVRTLEDLERRAREADVLVVSGLWRNTLIARAEDAVRAIVQRRHGSI